MPRRKKQSIYQNERYGHFGKMGSYGSEVKYIQCAIPVQDLNIITLVENIPGSSKWGVRELFQRGVDRERVNSEIIPYFEDSVKEKFFNPLTVAILPMEGGQVASNLVEKPTYNKPDIIDEIDDIKYKTYEAEPYYKLYVSDEFPEISIIKWNTKSTKLVAIDGQHRLSALLSLLQTWQTDPDDYTLEEVGFKDWVIPIVIMILPVVPKGKCILDTVREIFVTINKQAKRPSRAQNILLDDYSITAICCQEYLNHCHKSENSKVPLYFFDWHNVRTSTKGPIDISLLSIEELEDIHIHYLIGEDGISPNYIGNDQKESLNIDSLDPPINFDETNWQKHIRKLYTQNWIEAFEHMLYNFKPINKYIRKLEELESSSSDSHIKKMAISLVKYGTLPESQTSHSNKEEILAELGWLWSECKKVKESLDLFGLDIGLRGIFSAFSQLKKPYQDLYNEFPKPLKYAKWFIKKINNVFDNGFLSNSQSNKLLQHIVRTASGSITNYKHSDQKNCFGSFSALCVVSDVHNNEDGNIDKECLKKYMIEFLSNLESPLKKGYRNVVRANLDSNLSVLEFNKKLESETNRKMKRHIEKIKKELGIKSFIDS